MPIQIANHIYSVLLKAFNTTLLIKICLRSFKLAFFYSEKFDKLIINDSLNSKNVLHYFEEQEIAWKDDDSTFFLKLICLEISAFSSSSYFCL